MKITYKVWKKNENFEEPRLLITYKTEKAATGFARKYTRKFKVKTEVVELIKERGEEPYGNLLYTAWPPEKRD